MVAHNTHDTLCCGQLALARHTVSGELYIVRIHAIWDDDWRIIGRIVASAGPISPRGDLGTDGGPLASSAALFDRIERTDWGLTDVDADWLQAADDAGRLAYPIGVR